jgi:signal transduction histidine kinase
VSSSFSVTVVDRVLRIGRAVAPLVVGFTVFLFSMASPGEDPVHAMVGPYGQGYFPFGVLFGASVVCGLVATIAHRWQWPLFVVTLAGWLVFSIFPAVMLSSYYAALRLHRRWHALAYLGGATALIVIPPSIGLGRIGRVWDGVFIGFVTAALIVALPYAIGMWVSARRQVIAGLHERAARLEAEQVARAEAARADERARIAREMHDVVAHRVALMVLHAGALEVNTGDPAVAEQAALIRTTGREALGDLRQVLGVLRDSRSEDLSPQPDLSELDRLVDQARSAGLPVKLSREGDERELPLTVQRTGYRIVQEGLTNVVKHTGGASTRVVLRYLPGAIEVVVDNDAPLARFEPMPGSGLGLIGLQERVALLEGQFHARVKLDGGFLLTAMIPTLSTGGEAA